MDLKVCLLRNVLEVTGVEDPSSLAELELDSKVLLESFGEPNNTVVGGVLSRIGLGGGEVLYLGGGSDTEVGVGGVGADRKGGGKVLD